MDISRQKLAASSILAILVAINNNNNKVIAGKPKRIWMKEWLKKYGTNGHYENVYGELRLSDPDMYRRILRIYPEDFDNLLKAVSPLIEKE